MKAKDPLTLSLNKKICRFKLVDFNKVNRVEIFKEKPANLADNCKNLCLHQYSYLQPTFYGLLVEWGHKTAEIRRAICVINLIYLQQHACV